MFKIQVIGKEYEDWTDTFWDVAILKAGGLAKCTGIPIPTLDDANSVLNMVTRGWLCAGFVGQGYRFRIRKMTDAEIQNSKPGG